MEARPPRSPVLLFWQQNRAKRQPHLQDPTHLTHQKVLIWPRNSSVSSLVNSHMRFTSSSLSVATAKAETAALKFTYHYFIVNFFIITSFIIIIFILILIIFILIILLSSLSSVSLASLSILSLSSLLLSTLSPPLLVFKCTVKSLI